METENTSTSERNLDEGKNENFYRDANQNMFDSKDSPKGLSHSCENLRQHRNLSLDSLTHHTGRPRSLMETLLVAKMEAASNKTCSTDLMRPLLMRVDSTDSASSVGSMGSSALGSELCHCDDCLLGIADIFENEISSKKGKVHCESIRYL